MQVECPKCNNQANSDDINVASDVVFCRQCNEVFALSSIVKRNITISKETTNLSNMPVGVLFEKLPEGFKIVSTTRSPMAFFIIPFMLVWSGGSLGGIYGSQIISGKFNLFMSLFGIPFLIGSVIFWTLGLMMTFGKVSITVINNQGNIFTGIGDTGYQRKFNWKNISTVSEKSTSNKSSSIVMEGNERIIFGSMISSERRYFVIELIKKMLNERV